MDSIYKILESLDQVNEGDVKDQIIRDAKIMDEDEFIEKYTGEGMSKSEAEAHWRNVNESAEVEESKTTQDGSGPWYKEQRAKEMAEKIAAHDPNAIRSAKQAVMRGLDLPLKEGLHLEKMLASQLRMRSRDEKKTHRE